MVERWLKTEPIMAGLGLLMALALVVFLPALALETRVFQGQNVWIKPIKFQLALAVYLLTLAFMARWVPAAILRGRRYWSYAYVVCFCVLAEVIWISGAASFATASHYNTSTAIMEVIYGLMGIFAITLTSISFVIGWLIWKNPSTGLDPALHLSIAVGLMLTFVLTVISASVLAGTPGHHIGAPVTGASLPVLGWSREVGDLRVAHFLATHMMHFLPVVGVLALLIPAMRLRIPLVAGVAIAYCGLVGFTLLQALSGKPFLPSLL